jgi:murein L,D-transpeptidase YcbB/YkuD
MLGALGYLETAGDSLRPTRTTSLFTPDLVEAVEAFRAAAGLSTSRSGSPPGLVDRETVQTLRAALEREGRAADVRARLKQWIAVRR